jgi:hypothetical protein
MFQTFSKADKNNQRNSYIIVRPTLVKISELTSWQELKKSSRKSLKIEKKSRRASYLMENTYCQLS